MRSAVLAVAVLGFAVTLKSLGDSPDDLPHGRKANTLRSGFITSFAIGAAIPGAELSEAERQLLFRNFSAVTPENCMKPAFLHPAEDRWILILSSVTSFYSFLLWDSKDGILSFD